MNSPFLLPVGLSLCACAVLSAAQPSTDPASPGHGLRMRIGAAQPRARLVDYRLANPAEVLAQVDRSLGELERIVHQAGAAKCDAVALPEDTCGLGTWEAAHKTTLKEVLPEAVKRMLDRLGQAAAPHRMYLVCCNDTLDPDGSVRNTAFLLGRDGREIGRYHKVNMPIHELDKRRGDRFPVFKTPDLGGVGMLICYDMVFPEAARCLALNGADIIFDPTEGGAAIGDDDLSRAAFRTRAAENFVYLVVAQRGGGSMIISPQGKILAEGKTPDEVVITEIDPFGGREGGDAMNSQSDMRARLFRERSPAAFATLTDPKPPILAKVPETMTIAEALRISTRVLTAGDQEFNTAAALAASGKTNEAIAAFRRLRSAYRDSWIDRVSAERLAKLGADTDGPVPEKKPVNEAAAGGELPAHTTLSDPGISFTVPDKPYAVLRRGPIEAVVVDNRAVDDAVLPGHRAGYHGIASLKHAQQPRSLFVPAFAGLNFEHIHDGTTQSPDVLYEPRRAPMELRLINDHTAELHQPSTPHWGLESCLRYELLENGALEMTFECVPRRATWKQDYLGLFWASYIHQPESLDLHFLGPGAGNHLEWVRGVTPEHGIRATHRAPADDRDFVHDADFPMSLVFNFSEHRFAKPWYFGECRGLAFAEIFRAEDRVRFSQSPSGGGAGNPAWDFQWFISQPRIGQRYQLVMRALYTPLPRAVDNASAREELREQIERVQFSRPAEPRTPASRPGVGFFVDPRTNSDNPEQRMAYGLNTTPPPVARGLAVKYPGDAGIAADPDVLFAENFETGSVEEIGKRWGALSNQDGKVMAFSDDVPPVSAGKRSLQMTATLGENTGGHLYTRLPRGADRVFARFYVKFAPDAGYVHHFVTLGGYHPPTAWPQGGAGERPRGDERFTAGIEPYGNYGRYPAPGAWNFYAYWPEMKGSADGRFWGNSLTPAQPARVPRDRWQCVEVMLQCNSAPDKSDGELALWLDGHPTLHLGPGAPRSRWTGLGFSLVDQGGEPFEGFRWRTSRDLQINFFWLLHYVTENAPRQNRVAAPNPINRVWFDDIVVSTAYVGPISR